MLPDTLKVLSTFLSISSTKTCKASTHRDHTTFTARADTGPWFSFQYSRRVVTTTSLTSATVTKPSNPASGCAFPMQFPPTRNRNEHDYRRERKIQRHHQR